MTTSPRVRRAAVLAAAGALAVGLVPMLPALASGPAAPTGLSPDSTSVWQKNVVLSWTAVAGASSYDVQISSDGFDTDGPVLDQVVSTNQYSPPVSLPRGNYVWRVDATTSGGGTSAWSAQADLLRGWDPSVTTTLTTPADGNDFSFQWAPIEDASFYEVELSNTIDPATGAVEFGKTNSIVCFTSHTAFTYSAQLVGSTASLGNGETCSGDLTTGSTYGVRVRGRDGTEENPQSTFPGAGIACTGYWTDDSVPGYVAEPECSSWSNEVLKSTSTVNGAVGTITGLASFNGSDATGPCDVATPCKDAPLLTWTPDANAVEYRLYLTRDPSGFNADKVFNVFGSSFRVPDTMADRSVPTYWYVVPFSDNQSGGASAMASFDVANSKPTTVGATPNSVSPSVGTPYVDITWPTTLGLADHQAKVWELQLSTSSSFSSVATDVTTDRKLNVSGFSTRRFVNVPEGTVYYRYRAEDQSGRMSNWSGTVSFVHDSLVPVISISTAGGFGLTSSVTLKSTRAIVGATASTMGVILDGTKVSGSLSKVNSTTYTFTADKPWVAGAPYSAWVSASVTDASDPTKVATASPGTVSASGLVDSKSKAMRTVNGDYSWSTHSASDAVGGSFVQARHKASSSNKPYVSAKVYGTKIRFRGCYSPSNGIANVFVDGIKVGQVDLYRSFGGCAWVYKKGGLSAGQHTVQVVVSGAQNSKSSGTYVDVDALKVS